MQMSGLLTAFPPAELLQWAHNDRVTGTLVLRRRSREKRILLRDGDIVGCLSNERFDFYGQFLLAAGYISEHELLIALTTCEESAERLPLGEALTQLDLLDQATVIESLMRQTEQSIIDIFLWPQGVFFLLDDPPQRMKIEMPPLDVVRLVFKGAHQIDEVARIRERLPHDSVVLLPGPAWPGDGHSPQAQRILGVFGPDLTLTDLHTLTGGGYCQFLAEVDGLLQAGVFEIDRLEEPEPDGEDPSLLAIMLDRIQAEREAKIGATVSMPLTALGQFYPLWLKLGKRSARSEVSKRLADFVRRLDGARRLDDLLDAESTARDEQIEWLWLQIASRRLALLPQAVSQDLRRHLLDG